MKDGASPASKKTEVTSILKRRASDQALLSNSTYSLPDDSFEGNSEDSASQGGYSERSEISDEPVLGRRAIREKGGYYGSDDEESDDDYAVSLTLYIFSADWLAHFKDSFTLLVYMITKTKTVTRVVFKKFAIKCLKFSA